MIWLALRHRPVILLLVLILLVTGIWKAVQLPIDAFPDVSTPQVKVIVKAPGMTPEEVEQQITIPLELELLGIPHQTILRSLTKYALVDLTLDFEEGTDIYWARQQVAERLTNIWGELPKGVFGGLAPLTTPLGEMVMFTLEGEGHSLQEKRFLLDWLIRPRLRTVQGVADVNVLGGEVRAFEIVPDLEKLAAFQLSLDDLLEVLKRHHLSSGAGRARLGEEILLVRIAGRFQSLEDLKRLVVAERKGKPILLEEVAEVHIGHLTRYGAVSRDGRGETVEGLVLGLRGSNAREVVRGVRAELEKLQEALPKGLRIDLFYDRGYLVEKAVAMIGQALLMAVVLVIAVLFFFLANLTAALCVVVVLPLAACATFIAMSLAGISANLMSLGGLAIAIGMLVDGAIVVVDNIVDHLRVEDLSLKERLELIAGATREIARPVISGTLIIVIVFLPLLSLTGLEGKLFKPVAWSIIYALASALVLALLAVPVFASFLIRQGKPHTGWLKRLEARYHDLLERALHHRRPIFVLIGAALLFSLWLFLTIGKIFLPTMDEGSIVLQTEKLPSISLEKSMALDLEIQRALLEIPEVIGVVSRVGTDELGLDPMGLNETDHFLILKPRDEWQVESKEEILEQVRRKMETFPGIAYGLTQPIEMRVSEMLTGVRGDVAIKIFGSDLEETAAVVRKIPGAAEVVVRRNEGVQFLNVEIEIDHAKAGYYGISTETVINLLKAHLEGLRIGIIQEGNARTPLIIRGQGDLDRLQSLLIPKPGGGWIPLSEIAKIEMREGIAAIEREQGGRYAVVRINVEGRDLDGFVREAQQEIRRQVVLPEGYFLRFGGQFENQQRAMQRLKVVIPIALGLIAFLLYLTFERFWQVALILGNIPLALVGGIVALWLSGEFLSVPASVGFIALFGIAILNGVVLVSYFNQLSRQGYGLRRVILEGSRRRLRPVLMTAATTILGLLPLLFAEGPGSEIQRPLAIVVVGGLLSSTTLTLFVLPLLYDSIEARRRLV